MNLVAHPQHPLDYPPEDSTATFDFTRTHRFTLWRVWDRKLGYVAFVGLNPSTADEAKNDPTVARCIKYAERWGYGAMCMLNAFSLRSTDPKGLYETEYPDLPANSIHIATVAKHARLVVACWGEHGRHTKRDEAVRRLLLDHAKRVLVFDFNKSGRPKHPLYLRGDLESGHELESGASASFLYEVKHV